MSPYPAQMDRAAVIDTARQLIERDGLAALSLGKLAQELGVKAPSLYHHIANKADLLRGVNTVTLGELADAMTTARAGASDDPVVGLMALGRAYRAYAHAHPVLYQLLFGGEADIRPDEADRLAIVLPLQALVAHITGEAESLPALRGLWALMHGFVSLELAEQFQRPASVDVAWEHALHAYLAGWR